MKDISQLTEEERKNILARRAYQRQWRANNQSRVAAANARFYQKKAAKAEQANSEDLPGYTTTKDE